MNPTTFERQEFFRNSNKIYHASAPGRLDVMGGIADYSGSYVLQMPIAEQTDVYLSLRTDGILRAHSQSVQAADIHSEDEIDIKDWLSQNKRRYPLKIHSLIKKQLKTSWAAYIFGCVMMFIRKYEVPCQGADIWIESKVPIGKGVSSSAALEVATLSALCAAFKIDLPGNELPMLAQQVENVIVGAPCGLMDQLATYFGRENQLLPILCRPDRVEDPIDIPNGVYFVGVDSGVRHAVSGASYSDVRTAAFMGYTLIATSHQITTARLSRFKKSGNRNTIPYQGYLTAITPSVFEKNYASLLPEKMSGGDFISQYEVSIDPYTAPQPNKTYNVFACTQHPVYEHHRVQQFGLLLNLLNQNRLSRATKESVLFQLGELMYLSHESYNRCGLGSAATDSLVEQGRTLGPEKGIYGAKITGGGGGGTVCFLCFGRWGLQTVKQIAERHSADFHTEKTLFTKSGNGAKWRKVQKI